MNSVKGAVMEFVIYLNMKSYPDPFPRPLALYYPYYCCLTEIATSLLANSQRESLFGPLPEEPDGELGRYIPTKKESLSLPRSLLLLRHLPPFLVRSSGHEYRAQITSRLNKVFSLPPEQRPFWRQVHGGDRQNEQQRRPSLSHNYLASSFFVIPTLSVWLTCCFTIL